MTLPLLLLAAVVDLSPDNAPRLKVAWRYDTKAIAPNEHAAKIAAFEATPVLAGNLLYVITPFNQVITLGARSGVERDQDRKSVV